MKNEKRVIDVLVLSDIHLGTYGCRSVELLEYLKSVKPKVLILNGDIIDVWQFKKSYFPKTHMKLIKYIFSLLSKGVKVYYITGNHDELFRKFEGFNIGGLELVNQVSLNIGNENVWFFHGDILDVTMQHSRWVARMGAVGYDFLILLNAVVNKVSAFFGYGKFSLSKKIKNKVKGAVSFINNFEKTVIEMAYDRGYDRVVCGHIHHPVIKKEKVENKTVHYMNSGDWVENLSALEYVNGLWSMYNYSDYELFIDDELDLDIVDRSTKELFSMLSMEFQVSE